VNDELTKNLATAIEVTAPDGLTVRILNRMKGGSMAEFRLGPLRAGRAIRHRTVEEIWVVTAGGGTIWREGIGETGLAPGVAVAVPPGMAFQVRAGGQGLAALAVTMPPWPGEDEADVLEGVGPWLSES